MVTTVCKFQFQLPATEAWFKRSSSRRYGVQSQPLVIETAESVPSRRLILLRHAKSSWKDRSLKDHDRPLSKAGEADVIQVAYKLQQLGWIPQLILSSDANRTRQTLKIMQEQVQAFLEAEIHFISSFYSIAAMDGQTADHLQRAICKYATDDIPTVMCMGHNRGWEEAASTFSGASIELKTCNAALLEAAGKSWEEIWSGDSSVCSKKLKHYPAFIKEETTVTVNSFALIKGEEGYQHIGYVEDLYEDYSGHKMVKVRWFNCSEEVTGIPSHEVLITPHVEVVSAECIDGLATVLTPKHYQQCLDVVSEDFSDGIYMCKRQMKNNSRVTTFPVCKLRGYLNQTIFSILNPPPIIQQVSNKEEANKGFGVGEEIEVLSNDSGLRGCWFRCKILKAKEKCIKVVYMDVEDAEDPSKNIEEWIAASGVAVPDKLGMRYSGRQTIRPFPPSRSNECFSIGAAVDFWWCDAWWEGVVVTANNDTLRVYFPGENRFQNCEKKNLRRSKDWVDNKWLEIKPKPDIGLTRYPPTLGSATSQK